MCERERERDCVCVCFGCVLKRERRKVGFSATCGVKVLEEEVKSFGQTLPTRSDVSLTGERQKVKTEISSILIL